MKQTLGTVTKLLLLLAAAGLIIVLYTPIWRIDLDAPQYPEGLNLKIHASGLRGNVDIINGLNHYIGMKTLHNEDFIEFTVLPYLVIFFAAAFALVAFINKRRWLNVIFVSFVVFGILAMYDFWKWEYDYGHNLDPNAAIIVPGMAYQPPLIGFKQLLNFGAYSIPDIGGWIFIGAGVLLLTCVVIEWRKSRVVGSRQTLSNSVVILLMTIFFNSCKAGPEAIVPGTDNCHFCKMTISDARYGAEIVTKKGRVYKFDDIHCLLAFNKTKTIKDAAVKDIYLADFTGTHALIKANESFLLQGSEIHGPMNGDVIAFKNKDSMNAIAKQFSAVEINWQQLKK